MSEIRDDYFTDAALCENPFPYFEQLRARGAVHHEPHHNVAMVTTFEEALAVFNDASNFSACNAAAGPFPPLPFVPDGDDISDQIDAHRGSMPSSDLLVTYDRPDHPPARSLLMRLFTPRRLRENEDYIRELARRLSDEIVAKREAEAIADLCSPFATLVIADLLGIPEEDRAVYRDRLTGVPGAIGEDQDGKAAHPLEFLHESFTRFIADRRAAPRGDVLTDLATATYPDGATPAVIEVVRVAVNLFAAGQETTARLIATALRILAEDRALQDEMRRRPERLPEFVEEVLRLEGPVKGTFRLTRRTTCLKDTAIKAGTTVMVAIPSINRDPARYPRPDEIDVERPRIREHLAFGRGVHTCPGAPLARTEARIMLEELLARTSDIRIAESRHGAAGARRFSYAPTYLLRGLTELHLEFAA